MKYHKIRNVSKEVCTAEQKIAYNLARARYSVHKKEFDRVNTANPGAARNDCERLVCLWMDIYTYGDKVRYDVDAIACALRSGIYDFMCNPFIATSYEQVGRAFPANYL